MADISNVEALEAFSREGTMAKAATALRVTQSAVSKRIAALEREIGFAVIEPQGRRAVLTPRGVGLLERVLPVLASLRGALRDDRSEAKGRLDFGVAESILSSWGADLLLRSAQRNPTLQLAMHAHRGPIVVDRVVAGEFAAGLVADGGSWQKDLWVEALGAEPMAIIVGRSSRAEVDTALRKGREVQVISIEERSGTWQAISRRAGAMGLRATRRGESFFSVASLARAGFGHGLVPLGVCRTLKLRAEQVIILDRERLARPLCFIARRSTAARPLLSGFLEALKVEMVATQSAWKES